MAEVLGTNGQTATMQLREQKTGKLAKGTVSVRMDEVEHQHDLVSLKLRATHVRDNKEGGKGSRSCWTEALLLS